MTREGDDLLLNVRLSSDVQPYTEPTGTVRLVGQYTGNHHLETIDGLILKDTVQVSAETALQVAGTYVKTVGTDPNYIVHYPGIASYSGIEDILSVGTGNDYLDGEAENDPLWSGGDFIFVQPLSLRLAGKSSPAYRLAA